MARLLLVSGLALLCRAAGATAAGACGPQNCSACSAVACRDPASGCHDLSPPNAYSADLCVACDATDRCVTSLLAMDPSLGCASADNFRASLLLGALGGFLACLLPCCALGLRAERKASAQLLDEADPGARRVLCSVVEKLTVTSSGEAGSHTQHALSITFEAGGGVMVRGRVLVRSEFWEKAEAGGKAEVAYRLREPRDFVLVGNEELSEPFPQKYILGASLCGFFVVGAALGAVALLRTGCAWGLAVLAFLLLAGTVVGQLLCVPFLRRLRRSRLKVVAEEERRLGP